MSDGNGGQPSGAPAPAPTPAPATPPVSPDALVARRDPLWFMDGTSWVKANPCFRISLMYGIASGFGFFAHTQYRHRDWKRSNKAFLKAMPVVSLVSWQYCRWSTKRDRRLAIESMNRNAEFQKHGAAAMAAEAAVHNAGLQKIDKQTPAAPATATTPTATAAAK